MLASTPCQYRDLHNPLRRSEMPDLLIMPRLLHGVAFDQSARLLEQRKERIKNITQEIKLDKEDNSRVRCKIARIMNC